MNVASTAAAVLLGLAGLTSAQQMLHNPNFTAVVPASEMQAIFAQNKIAFSGIDFPRYWSLATKDRDQEATAAFDGRKLQVKARQVILAARNYRLGREKFAADGECRLAVSGEGQGQITFCFYCYDARQAFLASVTIGTAVVQPGITLESPAFTSAVFPPETAAVAPYFVLEGEFTIGGASLAPVAKPGKALASVLPVTGAAIAGSATVAPPPVEAPPPPEFAAFAALSSVDRQNAVLQSGDVALLSYAAGSGDRDVCNRACYRLGVLGEAALSALPVLVAGMAHPFEAVRVQAAVALTKLGEKAYPEITDILLGTDRSNRLTMATAVRGMPQGVPAALAEAVDWANPPVMLTGETLLPDSSFEGSSSQRLVGWDIDFLDGATGYWEIDRTRARTGLQSLRLVKTNGLGHIRLRSRMPVPVPSGQEHWTFRAFFQCFDASYNTLLLPRLETAAGALLWDDTSLNGGAGWQSQSLLRNTPEQFWDRRLILLRQRDAVQPLRPTLVLYGNPVTVWLDDVEFPASPWKAAASGATYPQPRLSLDEALAVVAQRPPASVEVRPIEGQTALVVNGKREAPVLYLAVRGALGDYSLMTGDAGVQFPVVRLDLRSGGNYPPFENPAQAGGQAGFGAFFTALENAVRSAPQAHLILGLNIAWPDDYIDRHPDQAWLDRNGRRAWGTLGHLGGFADELPAGGNPDNPYVWWPSQYSERAFLDAEQTVRDFLLELKQKPYAHIIAGIFICGGHDGQFMISYRDYSAPSLEQWRQFLRERYGSDAALAKSWNRPGATIDAAEILPDNPENASDEMFYSPTEHQAYADFKEFEDRQIWKNPERFARLFKEIFGSDKLAMTWSMGGGWRKNFDYFFASKHLDAFVAQPSYEYRLPGSSGGFNMVAESYSRHGKLAISELDTRNWMRGVYNELMTMRIGTPGSADHFQTLVMKEAGRMVSRYHGYWFYDIGGNAYRHPAVAEVIRTTREAADWVFQQAGNDDFVPDVAVVFHQPTIYWEAPWVVGKGNLASYLIDYQLYAMRLSGVPFSCYYLSDVMANPEFQKHKVYIFLNAFYLRESERAFIRDKLQGGGRTLVWNYAAGFLQEGGQSAAGVSALTGMTVHLDDAPATQLTVPVPGDVLSRNLPPNMGVADVFEKRFTLDGSPRWKMAVRRFWVDDPEAVALGKYHTDGKVAVAVKRFADWTSVYSAQVGGLDAELLANIAGTAGAYALTRPGLVVDMNGHFLSLHAFAGGAYRLRLPRRARVFDVASGKVVAEDAEQVEISLPAQSSRWLLLQ